jgi:hypothetical protein
MQIATSQTFADVLVMRSCRIAWDFHYFEQRQGNNSVQGNCRMRMAVAQKV